VPCEGVIVNVIEDRREVLNYTLMGRGLYIVRTDSHEKQIKTLKDLCT
jgi:hypothetical protein